MHGTAFAGTQRRTRRTSTGNLRTRTLENWLARDWTSGRGTHGPSSRCAHLSNRRDRSGRRSFVHRPRPRLRNNHARRRRLRRPGNDRRSGGTWRNRSLWRCRCGDRGRCRRGRSNDGHWWRRYRTRWRGYWRRYDSRGSSRLLDGGHNYRRRCGRRRNRSGNCRRCRRWSWSCHRRRSNYRLNDNWWRCRPRWRSRSFLLLRDGLQHITRPGNVRQVDFGLDFFFTAQRPRGFRRRGWRFGRAAQVDPYFFRFMLFQRTGMGLLLRHSDER